MIYATGYVVIIEEPTVKYRKKIKRKYYTLEFLDEERTETSLKIKYAYTAFLPKSYECRFLDDYTGKVKPFLERQMSKRIVRLQVTHLNYVSEEAIQKMNEKRSKRRK